MFSCNSEASASELQENMKEVVLGSVDLDNILILSLSSA